jgi:putative flavoprotein involved in K+ transport
VAGEVIVLGAGAAGLAVAAGLGRQGVAYTVLERSDSVGAAWRSRYDSLRLHTARWLSALPGAPIPRRFGLWVRRDDLVSYLEDYARTFDILPEFGVEVTRMDRIPQGWRLQTSAGPRDAAAVVVATGYTRTPARPDWPGVESFGGSLIHSVDYREPAPYRDQDVLVVGAGNSAAEIAVEVAGVARKVRLAVRTPPNIVRRDTLGVPSQVIAVALGRLPERVLNPLLGVLRRLTVPDLRAYGLPAPAGDAFTRFVRSQTVPILDHGFVDAVRRGRIRVVAAVESVADHEVRLADGTVVYPNAVIAATGYHPGLTEMVGHLGVLDASGRPTVQGAQTAADAPGLYFVGISVVLAGQLREITREARDVAQQVAALSPGSSERP